MTNSDPKIFEAAMRAAPRQVRNTCITSWLLGTILAVRFFVLTPSSAQKSAFFLALIFFNFVFNGVAILARSKLSYVLLAFFSSLSLLGATEAILDLIGLFLTDQWRDNSIDVAVGLFGVIVAAVIALLFWNLFSKETRTWVWSKSTTVTQESNAATS